ncbi:M56 family metallopeptidase [Algoriphagus boritolerans]|uniref:M56 family metallopeptidase n=1 Tax=Algoriphagus boritolerans TaxID=308111 RepID=UPI000A5DF9A2
MRLLNDWVSESLLKALGWTLVHSVWQLILIAAVLWISLKIVHRAKPSLKYGLAVGALALAFIFSAVTFAYQYEVQLVTVTLENTGRNVKVFTDQSLNLSSGSQIGSEANLVVSWIEQNISLLVNFWFLGALLFLFRLINSFSELRILRKSATAVVDFQIQRIAYRLANKMGVTGDVRLKISTVCISPLTFGTFKPIILLPAGLLFQLSPAQLEAIIAHELAHVKRNDYIVNLLLSGLEVIFFFHPCYWWMNNTVKELRENAADDLVMKAGIEPKNLATSLAEVLNFAKQNPPELALAASKRRNPTLQRIKRMLGYPAQNYPQNPIISIPMLLTLLLSAGLMGSAQQDTPKPMEPVAPISAGAPVAGFDAIAPNAPDTTVIKKYEAPESPRSYHFGKNVMVFSDGGYSYRISGDTLISDEDTIILSGKTKIAFDKLQEFSGAPIPEFNIPNAPMMPMNFEMAPLPDFNMEIPSNLNAFAVEAMPFLEPMNFAFEMGSVMPMMAFSDTTKMSQEQREKLTKEWAERSKEFAKQAEQRAQEWSKRSEEWAAKWKEEEVEREAKMEAWKKEFEPKMKEFEQKMKEWQAAQEPKIKEFEQKLKEWEATHKPKMEEFQKRMEVWQKEHQAKLQEFQKLVQEELKKR